MVGMIEVGTGGELTLSPEVLEHLGVGPGEPVKLFMLPGGMVRIRKAVPGREAAPARTILRLAPKEGRAR